jgi:Protein of unknown function (DUF3108)
LALAISVVGHFALSLWPVEIGTTPETLPLKVTITELPPPPTPAVVASHRSKARRAMWQPATISAPKPTAVIAEQLPPTDTASETPAAEDTDTAATTNVAAPPTEVPILPGPVTSEPVPKQLPPRVDLKYTVFLGTQGFMIGDATYRFEYSGSQYRMETIVQARGLAALLIRGQGRAESRGLITTAGLQPQEFSVERSSRDQREVAVFDWETGIVNLYDQKTAALELPTFDPLAVMWQFYFSPPTSDEQSFAVATTRRVDHYTITREGAEKIIWANGEIDTELWHRRSDDGKTDDYVWLAPALHYVPVKMRLLATSIGTIEAVLDSIGVDEAAVPR